MSIQVATLDELNDAVAAIDGFYDLLSGNRENADLATLIRPHMDKLRRVRETINEACNGGGE